MIDLSGHVVVLDLDDTLYLEKEFVRSGFAAVGSWMRTEHGIAGFGSACTRLFDTGIRGTIFDHALKALHPAIPPVAVSDLVEIYRRHPPQIALADDAVRFLPRLRCVASALISDGPFVSQSNKVAALDLERHIGKLILTAALPAGCGKPSPAAFEMVETWSQRSSAEHVYIADNPAKDFIAPRRRGWLTVQIQRPGRIHVGEAPTSAHAAVHAIESLDEIQLR
jgi:putative hydrolase of the HAD superfamily